MTALAEELDEISTDLSDLKVERDLLCQRAQLTYGLRSGRRPVRPEDSDSHRKSGKPFGRNRLRCRIGWAGWAKSIWALSASLSS